MSQFHQSNTRILVADDSELNRELLGRRISSAGFSVDYAMDGNSTLQMIEDQQYDLVLLDVMMPDVDGMQVLERVRKHHSMVQLPIIMVTARTDRDDIVSALKLGANDYVTKPVNHHVLLARIHTHLSLKRLAALSDESLATASHDLKKPVTLISDIVSTLQEELDKDSLALPEIQSALPLIAKSANYMENIISKFLDLQSLGSGHLQLVQSEINLNELAQQSIVLNREYANRKGIALRLELAQTPPITRADGARVAQVLENLVGNAIKFSPSNTQIVIRCLANAAFVGVEVVDHGPGVPEQEFPKLFEKFNSLSNRPTGGETSTGLGLAICKQVIDLHQGRICAHNNPDAGATFYFHLPTNTTAN